MRSFSTVTTSFLNDQVLLQNKKISLRNFLEKYGHLRAGTYDVTSNNYSRMNKKVFVNEGINSYIKPVKFKIAHTKKIKIQKLLNNKKIDLTVDQLFEYFENATKSRDMQNLYLQKV